MLVSGSPGAGKSTLARLLSDELGVLHVNKDRIAFGLWHTHPDDTGINVAAWGLFWSTLATLAASGISLVAEQTLWAGASEEAVRTQLVPVAEVVNVHCRCSTALDRWEAKMSAHPLLSSDQLAALVQDIRQRVDEFTDPLELGCPVVEVDTTDGYEPSVASLIDSIHSMRSAPGPNAARHDGLRRVLGADR